MICARRDGRCAGRASIDALVLAAGRLRVVPEAPAPAGSAGDFVRVDDARALAGDVPGEALVGEADESEDDRADGEGTVDNDPYTTTVTLRSTHHLGDDSGGRDALAHRPSRREEIIAAAISVFATHGFVDASIAQVADSASVAVTAVYYHFASKGELYEAALSSVLRTVDDIVAAIRSDDAPGDLDTLHRTIDAVWTWVDGHPDSAALMSLHAPAATRRSAELRHEFDEHHVRRAFGYVDPSDANTSRRMAEASIAIRVMVDLLIAIHAMRMSGGPLSAYSQKELRKAVKLVSSQLLNVSP